VIDEGDWIIEIGGRGFWKIKFLVLNSPQYFVFSILIPLLPKEILVRFEKYV